MSHMGRWLSALVDGELDAVERDRVLNHLAGCQPCLREANEMRALKRRLTALGETSADAPIAGRLIDLARLDSDAPGTAARPSLWSAAPDRSDAPRTRQVRQGWLTHGKRMATGAAGTAVVTIGVIAFMLGNGQAGPPAPKITPSVDSYWPQHVYDAGQQPAGSTGSAGPWRPGLGSFGQSQIPPATHASPGPKASAATPAAFTPGHTASPGAAAARHLTR